jgi:hypothetical protein
MIKILCIFLDPPLILGVIKLKNLRLEKIQRFLSLTKAWHRLVIDVFKYIFITEVANLFIVGNPRLIVRFVPLYITRG